MSITTVNIDASAYVKKTELPSNLTLYPANVASGVAGYSLMVTSQDDPNYNTVAVDVVTPPITGASILVASLATNAGVLTGNPGEINLTTVGNVKRNSGTSNATFYYELYHRNSAGVETLLSTSNMTTEVSSTIYEQFYATALLNNGTWLSTDLIVIKYYATKVGGGSSSVFSFQFGGNAPIRTILPVPASVLLDVPVTVDQTDVIDGTAGNLLNINVDGTVGQVAPATLPISDNTQAEIISIQTSKYGLLEQPPLFDHLMGNFQIVRKPISTAEIISHSIDTFRTKITSPTVKYLDQTNGSDSNDGSTWALAYKTLNKLKSVTFDRAYIASGNYADLTNNNLKQNYELISVGMSNMAYGFLTDTRTWADAGAGVWTNSISAVPKICVDSSRFDENGNPFRLLKADTLVECQATPDSFFKDIETGLLNIHTNDGLTPNRPTLLISLDSQNVTVGKTVYCENILFIGGINLNNTTATKNVSLFKNCNFSFSIDNNGANIRGNAWIWFDKCQATNSYLDGFNYHKSGAYNPAPIETYCIGYENGENNSSGINNGSTTHEEVRIIRVGCIYFDNEGPNVHDVNDAYSWNVDCIAYNSVSSIAGNKSDFALGAANGELCKMWLDGCLTKDDGTFGAENRSVPGEIFVRNSIIQNVEPGTVLIPY